MIYFTSDLHFFCKKGLVVGKRRFTTNEERNEFLIEQWNATVQKTDEIYLLGDISDGNAEKSNEMLRRLAGTKYLIIGNNDKYLEDSNFDRSIFKWCKQYYELLTMDTKFVLFHFPIEVWSGYGKDRIHLHGHLHRQTPMYASIRRYEVGVDAHDGKPVSIEVIWDKMKEFHNKDYNYSL